jgi:hypothetical protein
MLKFRILTILTLVGILSSCGGSDAAGPANPPSANQAPAADAGADQNVDEGATLELSGSGTDSDGNVVSYSWLQEAGTVVTITNADLANASFIAPSVSASEILIFRLTVTDDDGATGSDTVSITVEDVPPPPPPNQAPTADAGVDQTVNEGAAVRLTGTGADIDGTIEAYSWQQISGLAVVIVNADMANASFTAPVVEVTQDLTFRLTVTDDDGATGSDTATITVTDTAPSNTAPSVTIDQPADDSAFDSNETIALAATATDPEDGVISNDIAWTSDLDGNLGTGATLSTTLSIGVHILTASITDSGGSSASDSVTITVGPAPADSIEKVDPDAYMDSPSSLALDSRGNPVVSCFNSSRHLKVLHCNDVNCAGGDESIQIVDADSEFESASLALDSSGNPVVSYIDRTGRHLKVLHCNDANCAGGDESIESVDVTAPNSSTSLALDSSGNPVMSYEALVSNTDRAITELAVLHCNDVNCAGGDESIETFGVRSNYSSLELDSNDNPVVSYVVGLNHLTMLHCNDVNCAGGEESIETVDEYGEIYGNLSMALDSSGNPVVSYFQFETREQDGEPWDAGIINVAHCNDVNCAGGDDSIRTVDEYFGWGGAPSLALDSNDNPVVSYESDDYYFVKLAHCNDVNCAGGDESIQIVDTDSWSPSLALDRNGNPVVAYRACSGTWPDRLCYLTILHCNDADCAPDLAIDIKPGNNRNLVDLGVEGTIPIAILTSDTFDATQLDWETVRFGPSGASEKHHRVDVADADNDGDMDVVLHFRTDSTGILCGDTEATLTGETFGGEQFAGSDVIKTIKCPTQNRH